MTPKQLTAKLRAKLLLCSEDMSTEELNMFADVMEATSDVMEAYVDAQATIADLVKALERVSQELTIPAAEYVPAIPACFDIIDAALAGAKP
jgi:allophanate hydrolase subunit 1